MAQIEPAVRYRHDCDGSCWQSNKVTAAEPQDVGILRVSYSILLCHLVQAEWHVRCIACNGGLRSYIADSKSLVNCELRQH